MGVLSMALLRMGGRCWWCQELKVDGWVAGWLPYVVACADAGATSCTAGLGEGEK